ncbi:unnamed protein product [Trichobilharzia regenti]|nr:unnamed protein product [Trichobilharzia regenti]
MIILLSHGMFYFLYTYTKIAIPVKIKDYGSRSMQMIISS